MSEQGCRRFVGKVALVTGAGQGIGLATAWRLAREGAKVMLADKSAAPTREAAEAMLAEGLEVAVAIADLATYAGAQSVMSAAESTFGCIDVLVNNVGGTIWKKPFWHYTKSRLRWSALSGRPYGAAVRRCLICKRGAVLSLTLAPTPPWGSSAFPILRRRAVWWD